MKKVNKGVVFNLLFWTLYFLYQWFGLAALSGDYKLYLVNACMAFPLAFIVSVLTVHVLLKRFYERGEKFKFWMFQIMISLVLLLIRRHINYYIIYPRFAPMALRVPLFSFGKLIVEVVNLYLIVGLYSLFYLAQSWYENQQRVQQLLQEKTLAELELLKSQVQPHFIFNTLNNIYSEALRQSPGTAKLIAHLSSFLKYNLYESKQANVSLDSEIQYLKHYLELEKNRYADKLDASVNIYDKVSDLSIAPLLLLPLIENSIKHGIAPAVSPGWIRMDVSRGKDYFVVKIENSIELQDDIKPADTRDRIGLKNVKRRLQLIYPGKHEFKTTQEMHSYLAVLKIEI